VPLTATDLLASNGPIAERLRQQLGAYESRPQQLEMARAVASAMSDRSRLLVEAGTGVGKSFAYLVPAIARILEHGEKVVIATATIALQEQLISKDIPLLQATLADWPGDGSPRFALNPVLAKGRGNYVSIRRLELASRRQQELLIDDGSRLSLHVIEDWASSTLDGSLSSLPSLERPETWDFVRSDVDNCMGRKCPHYKDCFYQKARRELEQANLIICNHALFFSDLALRSRVGVGPGSASQGGILPPHDHVVLDEAHSLEDSACEHFGLVIAQPRVTRLLRQLFSPRRRKGYLLERTLALTDPEEVDRAIMLVQDAERASADFFADLHAFSQTQRGGGGLGAGQGSGPGRLRRPGVITNDLSPVMNDLAIRLLKLRNSLDSEEDRFELSSYAKRARDIAESAEAMVDQTLNDYVYWVDIEKDGSGARSHAGNPRGGPAGPRVSLACAPIAVAEILKASLWSADAEREQPTPPPDAGDRFEEDMAREQAGAPIDDDHPDPSPPGEDDDEPPSPPSNSPSSAPATPRPAHRPKSFVLTSATLATRTARQGEHPERAEAAFGHVLASLGLDGARTLQLGSPFDYVRQAKVIIDLSIPNPRGGDSPSASSSPAASAYIRQLADRICRHVESTAGGAFVLFTSFGTLHAAADACRPRLDRLDLPIFAQGRDGSRQSILKQFVETPSAVLFGASSFWQGVDVRGDRLRNVIITRLPFEPPDRPLTQARTERIELAGGNAFMQDSLPRAIIRFKQGFGRLIRSAADTGQVVILDPRIKTARYGKLFLDALPAGVRIELDDPPDAVDASPFVDDF
jgi:ATP-dependent DNA helicase DinG